MAAAGLLLIVGLRIFSCTRAATHWMVTENGRIEAQVDTVFHLRRPYDFMALLEQEKRADLVENLRRELMQQKEDIDRKEDKDTDLEAKLQRTEPDCIAVGKPLVEFDLYASTVVRPNDEIYKMVELEHEVKDGHLREPFCISALPLDFSMHAFEHLDAMKTRGNLSMESEESLIQLVFKTNDVYHYGHQVALRLDLDLTSWAIYNQATIYWRIQGDVFNAIECARRALHFSPREYKSMALVSLGNILHRARFSEEAVLVLHAAVDHDPEDPVTHYTLGNVYAVLADYNRSIACYENVIRLQSDYIEQANQRKHAVLCHKKLEQALESQHKSLQKTLSELRKYQEQYEQWLLHQNKLLQGLVPLEERISSRLKYKESKWKSSPLGEDCFEYQENGLNIISCNMKQHFLPDLPASNMPTDVALNLESLLKNVESKAEKLSGQVIRKPSSSYEIEREEEEDFQPTRLSRYAEVDVNAGKQRLEWPNQEECMQQEAKIPKWDEFPPVFLPPENKGFEVDSYLGLLINLGPGEEHPLPWYPPICEKLALGSTDYDDLTGIKGRDKISSQLSEIELKGHFLHYVIGGGASEAEVGQRILTAMKKKVGPSWLLQILASFYWRIHGNLYNSIECLRHALSRVPARYKDVALVNLAAVLGRDGKYGDEAIQLLQEAFSISPYEPATNMILGNIYVVIGNMTGAMEHYQRVLQVDPENGHAWRYLQALICHVKFHRNSGTGMEKAVCERAGSLAECHLDGIDFQSLRCQAEIQCFSARNNPEVLMLSSPLIEDQCIDEADDSSKDLQDDEVKLPETSGVEDDPLPDTLVQVLNNMSPVIQMNSDCEDVKKINWKQFTSTWLSVTTKGIDMKNHLGPAVSTSATLKPYCDANFPASMYTFDHLAGVSHRGELVFGAETGLKEAFQTLAGDGVSRVDAMAALIAMGLEKNSTSWVLTTAAALYWRITGDAEQAVNCLRQALHFAPRDMKDVPLISLANIFHRAGLYNDALIAANMALEISPKFVVIHFTMANIYAAKGDLEMAMVFYSSTLALQSSFEPARERLRAIQCTVADKTS